VVSIVDLATMWRCRVRRGIVDRPIDAVVNNGIITVAPREITSWMPTRCGGEPRAVIRVAHSACPGCASPTAGGSSISAVAPPSARLGASGTAQRKRR
jgi:hypothetical protein